MREGMPETLAQVRGLAPGLPALVGRCLQGRSAN